MITILPTIVRNTALALLLTIICPLGSAAAASVTLLAIGDSLTAGYGLLERDGFPAQLERALRDRGHDVHVINGGVSGDTSTGGLARLDWALTDNPDAVIIELGANDGLRAIDPAFTRGNLDNMLSRLAAERKPVLLTGMYAPPNLGPDYEAAFNSLFPDLAAKHDTLFYPFFLEGVAAVPALNQDDGIHPTAEGIAVIVDGILPLVEQLLEQLQ